MKASRILWVILLSCSALVAYADRVEMRNGDHYSGKVAAMTTDTIVFQSDVLGKISLPRAQVAKIEMGAVPPPPAVAAVSTNAPAAMAPTAAAAQDTNLVEQVRKQFLTQAGPVANAKYDQLVGQLSSGKYDLASLRAEAKSAADQIRALKKQGGEVGEEMESYLVVLDNFVKQSAPDSPAMVTPPASTNTPVTPSEH